MDIIFAGRGKRAWLIASVALVACSHSSHHNVSDLGAPDANGSVTDSGENATDGAVDGGTLSTRCTTAGTSSWATYAHDALRTSASDGCALGPLSLSWSYASTPFVFNDPSYTVIGLDNAIADTSGLYVSSVQVKSGGAQASILEKVSPAGALLWEFTSNHDAVEHNWPTLGFGRILVEDDWLAAVDANWDCTSVADCNACEYQPHGTCNNHSAQGSGFDDWGMSAADATRFYTNSDVASPDGPGIYIGAWDTSGGNSLWKQNTIASSCTAGGSEEIGSLVVDGGNVYQAANYSAASGAPAFASGVRSFAAATGTPGWTASTTVMSALSASASTLYLIEGTSTASLVARKENDGSIAWSKPLGTNLVSSQSPVQANGLVIVATASGVIAYVAATGDVAWMRADLHAVSPLFQTSLNFGSCGGSNVSTLSAAVTTSLAAATGSNTLVVAASDNLHIVALADGHDFWTGAIAGTTPPFRNPIIVGSTVYAIDSSSSAGKLVALTTTP
jgi:hypothetical protein